VKKILRKWLEIKDPKDWTEDFNNLENEMWKHRQLLKPRCKTNCPVCGKTLMLWPLEDSAYYTKDGKAYHVKCYGKDSKGK